MSVDFSENQWRTIEALSDAYIPAIELLQVDSLLQDVTPELRSVVAQKTTRDNRGFRQNVSTALSQASESNTRLFKLVIAILSRRTLAVPITHSFKLLSEMSIDERTHFIMSLRDAKIAPLRSLYRALLDLSMIAFFYSDEKLLEGLGYKFDRANAARFAEQPFWEVPIEAAPKDQSTWRIETDVVVIGSGSTGGVIANRLAKEGFRVLILEKGDQIRPSDLGKSDLVTDSRIYELSNKMMSTDKSINIVAGSTVGGGAAINWSCSLRLPFAVRRQWAADGVPWATSTLFDDAQDYVWKKMGTTYDYGEHSFTNQLILDGSKKLGYPAAPTGQNTGAHIPNTVFQGYGYRYGEKGGVVNWLYEAVQNGAKVIDRCQVVRIRHNRGKASGVEAVVNDGTKLVVNAKRVVSCCGSLQTPILLKRSGFKNKKIGDGLKLHPVTCVYGDFDEVVNKESDTIMTSVCVEDDNLDGEFHGPRIEAIHHLLPLTLKFLPWYNGESYRKICARYKHLSALLILTRDKGAGKVIYNKNDPMTPTIEYTPSKFDLDALRKGALTGANLLYIQGARRIYMPHYSIPMFESDKPASERRLADADYQAWYANAETVDFEIFKVGTGSAHQMASCRMSNKGPQFAPVDERGRLYECPNVHVVDTSVFPSASGVNPMISCMSVAQVLGGFLVEELRKEENRARL
ncbi:Long-chain-alcohol oxidase FAO2 [Wickerhamiella sorbophila]|uniref:Long-chain-alcohol oxidase n=1 Tax=Wickerhamiella sorbophila TaxID=45607 RepID=A0A2T0FEK3_9ASCO|nr:Long-chain-alcohol oxidase FAO2 [Wickerhamiella sorbophila]PRT53428.1 Long-chain-alcohol oxidase FAO2 [Wickerhamiella sorbophila]